MIHYAVAFALWLHVLFWGAGLAMLAMPRRWRRFWPVLAAPAGFALQTLVVWLGAYANLPGTDSYAWGSEIVPAGLLAVVFLKRRSRGESPIGRCWPEARRFGGVFGLSALLLVVLVWPMAQGASGLTTISLGSCDAADYAGGARVLKEFARNERGGFIGLTEVVRTMSADNFADYWLWLNHFGPAAIIALNGAVLQCAPHELTSLVTMLLLATTVPVVFWTARAVVRHRPGASVAVALLFAMSPVAWYAVAHVAMGQLVAAHAIALLTWAGVATWRTKAGWQFSGVLAIGYALVLGSYHFILIVALVPAVAFAGGLALARGEWGKFARWALAMLVPLVVCGVVFAGRVAGLVEFFRSLRTFDFGWRIPVLTPEGWLGFVRGTDLSGWPLAARGVASAAIVFMIGWTLWRRRKNAWLAVSLTLPVLAGYAFLEWRGARLGTNASYDAYKLFFVFLPVMLPVFCAWVPLRAGAAVMVLVLAGSGSAMTMFMRELRDRPLRVDGALRQVRKIEAMPDVKSVNVLLPDMWSRLWANEFLLRKPQYFLTDTYEARWHTPLRGEWDLVGGIIVTKTLGGETRQVSPHVALIKSISAMSLRADFGDGWHPEERDVKADVRWRWTRGDATLVIDNPQPHPLAVSCTIDGWGNGEREVEVVGAAGTATTAQRLAAQRSKITFRGIAVPPGRSILVLRSAQPATVPSGDVRALGLCVFGIELETVAW